MGQIHRPAPCLPFFISMKATMRSKQLLAIVSLIGACIGASARVQGQIPAPPPPLSIAVKHNAESFENRAKEYVKMREALE
jgi:hypothetical protein